MKNADSNAVVDIGKEKVFSQLLAEEKITPDVVESMRHWKHCGLRNNLPQSRVLPHTAHAAPGYAFTELTYDESFINQLVTSVTPLSSSPGMIRNPAIMG
ncbi:MAG: hypothetical protein JW795_11490 [Chitinivibrionales bacterium]|nr:hypothetical protein [Chitinivibrionales bacterium]